MTGETERSDFMGLVAMSAVAALDGCPWIEKGHTWELSSAVAELVVERAREVDSLLLPDGTLFEKRVGDPCTDCWKLVEEKQELRDKLADLRSVLAGEMREMRSAARQIELFMEDGERTRLSVALAILDIATEENQ